MEIPLWNNFDINPDPFYMFCILTIFPFLFDIWNNFIDDDWAYPFRIVNIIARGVDAYMSKLFCFVLISGKFYIEHIVFYLL